MKCLLYSKMYRVESGTASCGDVKIGEQAWGSATFKKPFASPPLVVTVNTSGDVSVVEVRGVTTTEALFRFINLSKATMLNRQIDWYAIGI